MYSVVGAGVVGAGLCKIQTDVQVGIWGKSPQLADRLPAIDITLMSHFVGSHSLELGTHAS